MSRRRICIALYLGAFVVCGTAATVRALSIDGVVFLDANANGRQDADERGAPGVVVSDGGDLVRTDASGRFAIPDGDPAKRPFVFAETPSGFRRIGNWYYRLPRDSDGFTVAFALQSAPETARGDFRFAHVTDTHVAKTWQDQVADLREVAALGVAFAVNTGDLVGSPDPTWYDNYRQFLSETGLPSTM